MSIPLAITNTQSKSYLNKSYIGEDGIIHNIYIGDQNAKTVKKTGQELEILVERQIKSHKKVMILADLTRIGKVSLSARSAGLHLMIHLPFDRAAIFGSYSILKGIVDAIVLAAGAGFKVRFYQTEQEARDWLRSRR